LCLWPELLSFDNSNRGKELWQNGQEANSDGPLTEDHWFAKWMKKLPEQDSNLQQTG
jgi:hypothetical protein